jgi:hypothetical protein
MSLRTLARRLPGPLYRKMQRLHRRIGGSSATPTTNPYPGPILTELAPRLARIPGWFNLDDVAHFTLVMRTQQASRLAGDLLEIGCYHGRSAALLAMHLQPGERLLLSDAFDLPLETPYGDTPTVEGVWRNLAQTVPDLPRDRISIVRAYSKDLKLPQDLRVRFAHVDGGHDRATVLNDLHLCARCLIPGGLIAVDDYQHPHHPGVTSGVDDFLAARPSFRVLADLNRLGALGRKLYLVDARPGDQPRASEPGRTRER